MIAMMINDDHDNESFDNHNNSLLKIDVSIMYVYLCIVFFLKIVISMFLYIHVNKYIIHKCATIVVVEAE